MTFKNNYQPIQYAPSAPLGYDPNQLNFGPSPVAYDTSSAVAPAPGSFLESLKGLGQTLQEYGVTDSFDKATGQKIGGWGGLAVGAANGLVNAFMGMKQYGLAKDQFNFQKNTWQKEYDAQKGLTNASLADRQDRRNAEAGNVAAWTGMTTRPQDTASYLSKYGVK